MCRAPHEMAARYAGRRLDMPTANRYTKRDTAGLSHTHPTPHTPGPPPQRRPYLGSLKSAQSPTICALTSNAGSTNCDNTIVVRLYRARYKLAIGCGNRWVEAEAGAASVFLRPACPRSRAGSVRPPCVPPRVRRFHRRPVPRRCLCERPPPRWGIPILNRGDPARGGRRQGAGRPEMAKAAMGLRTKRAKQNSPSPAGPYPQGA
jgi:hypothetical protein